MTSPRPFIKSAGGKTQLLPELRKELPATSRYFEPFVGGGALFFDVRARGWSRQAFLNDSNEKLIAAYMACRDAPDQLIKELKQHAREYAKDGEGFFYRARERFNRLKPARFTSGASLFILLNKTCYNGLWRVNRAGKFNVPSGKYKNPPICDEELIRACSLALKNTSLSSVDFELAVRDADFEDCVYFDPPYAPVSETANFVGYTKGGFRAGDQERLRDCAKRLKQKGVVVILSNADVPLIRKLYSGRGWKVRRIEARRAINSNASKRGPVGELIIT